MTSRMVPLHHVTQWEGGGGTSSLARRHGGLSLSQAWPVEHCTLWCINICLWLKFKQPSVAARHNRKPTSKGKCLLQWWPKEPPPAKYHIWLAGSACGVTIKPLATGHGGVLTLSVMVMFTNAQPCRSSHKTSSHADGFMCVCPEWGAWESQTTHIPAPTTAKQVFALELPSKGLWPLHTLPLHKATGVSQVQGLLHTFQFSSWKYFLQDPSLIQFLYSN